jgi:uncharacterized NAD(P)/FAD-binding protein YdhS
MNKPFTIQIIGGGVSSLLICQQLLSITNFSCIIQIIHSNLNFPKGTAYSPLSDRLLLNVPAGKMTLLLDEPMHFVEWLKLNNYYNEHQNNMKEVFVSRAIYGKYIDFVWNIISKNAVDSKHSITRINDKVIAIKNINTFEYECVTNKNSYVSNAIILATGNEAPRNPFVSNMNYVHSTRYYQNPWCVQINTLNPDNQLPIVILGTGLSMVDTVLELNHYFPSTKIYALSRKGYSILAHNLTQNSNRNEVDFEINESNSLLDLLSNVNKYRKNAIKNGSGIDQLFQSIRSKTNHIWLSLTDNEKKQFYNRLRHMWGVARHRVPNQSYDQIQRLRQLNLLEIVPVKLLSINENENGLTVEFTNGNNQNKSSIDCSFVINCTGPESDILKMDNELLINLHKEGLIQNDPLHLGALADEETLEFLSRNGQRQTNFFGIGNILRGTFWESTALEELRIQANQIKQSLLKNRLS